MKQRAELVKKCQERMKSIRDKNYFTLRFGKTKMYSEKPFKKINMKQTAVEWLVEQMIKYELLPESIHPDNVLFHKAKEMEKEQIENAYRTGDYDVIDNPDREAEQYYNQTFKSE